MLLKSWETPVVAVVGAVSGPKAGAGSEDHFCMLEKTIRIQIAFSSSSKTS